jgi:hypothetical protein
MFEQTVTNGSKTEIVALERVSILFAAGEKRRVSIAVADMSRKLQSGEPLGRPVLSVVAVEFLDGTQWSAPTASGAHARQFDPSDRPYTNNSAVITVTACPPSRTRSPSKLTRTVPPRGEA